MTRIHQSLAALALLCPLVLAAPAALAAGNACMPEVNYSYYDPTASDWQYGGFVLVGNCLAAGDFNAIELAEDADPTASQFSRYSLVGDVMHGHSDGGDQILSVRVLPRDHWVEGGKYKLRLLDCGYKGGVEKCAILYETFVSLP